MSKREYEIEKKFKDLIEYKFLMKKNFEKSINLMFDVFDELEIYDFIEPSTLLKRVKDLNFILLFREDLQDAEAFYESISKVIAHKIKTWVDQKDTDAFVHELLHCLSDSKHEIKPYSKSKPDFQTAFSGYKLTEEDWVDSDEISDEEMDEIFSGIMEKMNSSTCTLKNNFKPVCYLNKCGFASSIVELSRRVDTRSFTNGSSIMEFLDGIYKNATLEMEYYDEKHGYMNEGVNELLNQLVQKKIYARPHLMKYYSFNVNVAEQLSLVFGKELWKGFFTNSFDPMIQKLKINKDEFKQKMDFENEIYDEQGKLDSNENIEKIFGTQKYILRLFEKKMYYEIVKYGKFFDSNFDLISSIQSAYIEYSKTFYFGKAFKFFELEKAGESLWDEFEKSAKRVVEFCGRTTRKPVPKFDSDFMRKAKQSNDNSYGFLTVDGKELSLKDRIVPSFEKADFAVDQQTRRKEVKTLYN